MLLLTVLFPQKTFAQENKSEHISIEPTFQEITLEESTKSAQAKITLRNNTSDQQQFIIFPVDISQIDANGNVVFSDKPLAGSTYALSAFIKLYPSTIQLAAGESKDIDVSIYNAQNLSPGGHYSAVVARGIPSIIPSDTNQTILPALSSFVLVRKKGGERYHISLKSVSMSDQFIWWDIPDSLNLLFENQGNIHTAPRGQLKMIDLFQRVAIEGTVNESSKILLPESQREIPVELRKIQNTFPLMIYKVEVSGRSDPGDIPYQRSFFVLLISKWIATMIVVLIPIILITVVFRKKINILFERLWKKRS